jgi:hypothetical protein
MIGPILDNMVVSRYLLGDLVRRTAYYAYHFINSSTTTNIYEAPYDFLFWLWRLKQVQNLILFFFWRSYGSYVIRQRQIDQIAQKFKKELTLEEFYNTIFTKKIKYVVFKSSSKSSVDIKVLFTLVSVFHALAHYQKFIKRMSFLNQLER